MEEPKMVRICMLTLFLLATQLHWSYTHGSSDTVRKAYIVYMGKAPHSKSSATDPSVVSDDHIAKQSIIYSYTKSYNAFAANLLPQEVQRLQENENVVSVFPSKMRKLHTTRSWDFLGMPQSVKRNHQIERIYIDAPSFDDKGFGPPPSKWKGTCQVGGNFIGCNNKVIGARFYSHGAPTPNSNRSPLDDDGHGSHTSSTIAGASIAGASLYGLAKGTARGGVPSARIAVYKVCWADGCSDIDLLAGMDDAISDGVDLISISIGGDSASYLDNPIAIGAFHAMKKGILTTCSAGNDGPSPYTVENTAPWILTVGASSIDRQFRTLVKVGNGIQTAGFSINTFSPKRRLYPLNSAAKSANASLTPDHSPWLCDEGTLDAKKVKGKIVLCKEGLIQDYVKPLGVYGVIVSLDQLQDSGFTFIIPVAFVDLNFGDKIDTYVNSTKNPQAVIYKSTVVHNAATPFVASFSSRASELKIKDVQAELAYGAGQIDPVTAVDPGLIYALSKADYICFLCNEGYSGTALRLFTEGNTNCSSIPNIGGHDALNYPSMYLQLNNPNSSISAIFHRTVKNVGSEKAIYKATVEAPANFEVTVVPKELTFSHLKEKKSFTVVIKGPPLKNITSVSASLEWSDTKHRVKSPILIFLAN
ncbi:subtilisin-like protease SBT4.15 [Castanea sativa]|uniref:subtilisin-like protease SBT4.15 n=1 Tax=Castanea sativa TaxID=21020 RepID=UPI003F651536